MAWKAFCGDASMDGIAMSVTVIFREDSGQEFPKQYIFQPGETVTKPALKAKVAPDLAEINNRTAAVATVNTTLKGQDISTW